MGINTDLNVITNTDKQLIFANCRMNILMKLDQICAKINIIITRCDALKIEAKNKQKRKKKKPKKPQKEKQRLAATYVDMKTSLTSFNKKRIHINHGKLIKNKLQKKRILHKKLLPKKKVQTSIKFGLGSKFPNK